MTLKMLLGATLAVAMAGMTSATACSSGGTTTDGGSDVTSDINTASDTPAETTTHKACSPDRPYTNLWLPPSAWGQGACTQAQITGFFNDCAQPNILFEALSSTCAAFLGDSNNSACAGCLTTSFGGDAGSTFGPYFVTSSNGQKTIHRNSGGCVAHEDGMTGIGGCGEVGQDQFYCSDFECNDCDDYDKTGNNDGPHTKACYKAAQGSGGICSGYVITQACLNEYLNDASPEQICLDPTKWVTAWCGSADAGVQDAAGGG